MNRREFIGTSIAAALMSQSCNDITKYEGKRLIIIRLMGGWDGYHFIAPSKHPLFEQQRPHIYNPLNFKGIQINEDWKLHPQFRALFDLIQKDVLKIIPNVGFNDYSGYSHFTAERYWETGEMKKFEEGIIEKENPLGWIGKLGDAKSIKNIHPDIRPVITLDNYSTIFDNGINFKGVQFESVDPKKNYLSLMEEWLSNQSKNHRIFQLIQDQFNQIQLTKQLNLQLVDRKNLKGKVEQALEIIEKDLPFQIIHLSQDGYDTHANQVQRIEPLFNEVSESLNTLYNKLKDSNKLKDTLVFVYSEFGRSIETNDSGGTDHGKANHALLLSDSKNLNSFYFLLPEIQTFQVGRHHYVKHNIDYRDIQKRIIDWLV